jgi:chemotaxis protein CheX
MTMLEDDLIGLTGAIWESVLGMGARPIDPSAATARLGGRTMTSCVHITGEWEGSLAMTFGPALSRRLAAGMFGLDDADLDDELVRDAVGELANIAGGNVKGMVAAETELSLPQVIEGSGYTMSVPGTRVLCEAGFECGPDTFVVTVHGRTDLPC